WQGRTDDIKGGRSQRAGNARLNSFGATFEGEHLDASLLLMQEMGFLDPMDPRYLGTVAAVERFLLKEGYLLRYHAADDFGVPEVAFTICTFWYVDALTATGREEEARALFEQ